MIENREVLQAEKRDERENAEHADDRLADHGSHAKTATIVLLRSNANEQGFVVSPGQSELEDAHPTNSYPDAATAVTVPRVPSSPAIVTDDDAHPVVLEGESACMRTQPKPDTSDASTRAVTET